MAVEQSERQKYLPTVVETFGSYPTLPLYRCGTQFITSLYTEDIPHFAARCATEFCYQRSPPGSLAIYKGLIPISCTINLQFTDYNFGLLGPDDADKYKFARCKLCEKVVGCVFSGHVVFYNRLWWPQDVATNSILAREEILRNASIKYNIDLYKWRHNLR